MSDTVMLIAGMAKTIPLLADVDYVGIDRGALIALRQHIPLRCAIGDFDSVNEQEREEIRQSNCPIVALPSHKNETDSEQGVFYALEQGYEHILLFGGLGGRMDHTLANLSLLMHRDLPLRLMDEHHDIQKLKPGTYHISKRFHYLSFLALELTIISESGVAYPLDHQAISPSDIYPISNEILGDEAEITIHQGCVLMIQCDDEGHL